jgi:hypothetical protein
MLAALARHRLRAPASLAALARHRLRASLARCARSPPTPDSRALTSTMRAGLGPAWMRACVPSGSVSVAPDVCPDGRPKRTGPLNPRVSSSSTSRIAGSPPGSSQRVISPNTSADARPMMPAEPQLREEPVDPIRTLGNVFEKQDAALGRIERIRRAEGGRQLRERAADEQPGGLPRAQHLELRRRDGADRLGATQASQERVPVVAFLTPREPRLEHRAVKRDNAALECEPREQRRRVAVADEGLRRGPGQVVEQREQVYAPVTAPDGEQPAIDGSCQAARKAAARSSAVPAR